MKIPIILIGCLCIVGSLLYYVFHDPFPQKSKRLRTDQLLSLICTQKLGTNNTPIYIIDNFLSEKECAELIKSSKPKLEPATVVSSTNSDNIVNNERTNKTAHWTEEDIEVKINKKIKDTIKIYSKKSETPQVQNYQISEEYKPHYDYFQKHAVDELKKGGQRSFTFMIYLNDVEEGGQTKFVELNQKITPKLGKAVIWCNLDHNNKPDKQTLHAGMPVIKGEKWILTKWFRDYD